MRALVIASCAIALMASGAHAGMVADFEGGTNPFGGAGTIVPDPEDAGNNVLHLVAGEMAWFDIVGSLGRSLGPGESVSFRVYDQALSVMDDLTDPSNPVPAGYESRDAGSQFGWNIGVSGETGYNYGFALVNRSRLAANTSYACPGDWYPAWPMNSTIYSPGWYGSRNVGPGGLSIIGSGTIDNPEIPGDGVWSTWTIELLADGAIQINSPENPAGFGGDSGLINGNPDADPPLPSPNETGFSMIYLSGGRDHATVGLLGGVWVDDVTIIPEPASMTLLALGALALVRRRSR